MWLCQISGSVQSGEQKAAAGRGGTDMPGVRETGGDSALPAAVSAAAESRIARKSAQLEAGQVLIAEAARHAAEAKEALEKERAERKAEIGRAHV